MAYGGVIQRLDDELKCEASLHVKEGSVLFNGLETVTHVTLSHQDFVERVPKDFEQFGDIDGCIQVIESLRFLRFGLQFHPETKAEGASVCPLQNFCCFVHERATLPVSLSSIDERHRIRFNMILHRTSNLELAEKELLEVERDDRMAIWRHHIQSWNTPAKLIQCTSSPVSHSPPLGLRLSFYLCLSCAVLVGLRCALRAQVMAAPRPSRPKGR